MSNKRSRCALALLRGLLVIGAVGGLLWSVVVLPCFWRILPASDATARIIADERFKAGTLAGVLAGIEAGLHGAAAESAMRRAIALIRLRLAEEVMVRNSSEEADREVATAEQKVRSALEMNPGDSFLWMMLYSVQLTRNGVDPASIRHLEQSYTTGPFEGWISLRRNRLALAAFSQCSATMQAAITSEFSEMVDSDFIETAAANLTSVGWAHRSGLLSALGSIDLASKKSFYKRLSADGIKVSIPGLEVDERPWR